MLYSLRPLSPGDGPDIYQMLQEMPEEENGFQNHCHAMSYEQYQAWLLRSMDEERGIGLPDGYVPQSIFWLMGDGIPLGIGKLRHRLNEKLLREGGNIGYGIRPSARGQGCGTQLLRLLLPEARKLGIERVLLTVHAGNTPSLRLALRCGGVIERSTPEKYYIWINT